METSLVHSHCRVDSASRPTTTYLENDVWSKTATDSRVVRCSSATQGCQFCFPHAYVMLGLSPAGAKKFGRSQPIRLPKHAFWSASTSWIGERRCGRADSSSRFGHGSA